MPTGTDTLCMGFSVRVSLDLLLTHAHTPPQLEDYYSLEYSVVSLVFLSPFLGYACAALLNNWVHHRFGQRGIGIIGPLAHLTAYAVSCAHPPFAVLVVIYVLAGLGNGIQDAAWNAWVGGMHHPNELLGILHAFYGVGATIAPLIATTMITKGNLMWYTYYYVMVRQDASLPGASSLQRR